MSIFEFTVFGITIAPKWYWAMYALWFLISYQFVKKWGRLSLKELDSLLLYVFLWVILGGRLWYVLLYNFEYYLEDLSQIFFIWQWGMSFHGWLIGVILSVFLFSKKNKVDFFFLTDSLAIIVPVAIWLWRLGNYINGELPGYSPYTWPFAMMIQGMPHFPSPLLEMLLEWIVLFCIMLIIGLRTWYFKTPVIDWKYQKTWLLSAIFLLWYGSFRLIAEQFRLPDLHIGYLWETSWLTLGMIYTLFMFIGGILVFYISMKKWPSK